MTVLFYLASPWLEQVLIDFDHAEPSLQALDYGKSSAKTQLLLSTLVWPVMCLWASDNRAYESHSGFRYKRLYYSYQAVAHAVVCAVGDARCN